MKSRKMSIEWHREGLLNMKASLAREFGALERQLIRCSSLRDSVELREKQIAEAEKRGLTEFDSERLLVKRSSPPAQQNVLPDRRP